jgi:endonuclease I
MKNRIKIICLTIGSLTLAGLAGVMLDAHHPNVVQATDASTYYGSAIDWTATGATLKTALHDKIEAHTAGSYAGLWNIYKTSDIDSDGKIWDIYSDYRFTVGTGQCGTYSVEGDCYNREHLIPQSIFSEASPMVCDAHHIYPTDGKVNGMRSNYPHGFVTSATYTSGNGGKLGTGNSTYGYTSTCFEPVDAYKGDVARAYFYFVTAYQEKISGYSYGSFSQDTYPSLATWAIKTYLKWAYDDPVSQKEIDRNNAIYAIQGNRNPYVDHPEAAARVWDPNNAYGFFNTYGSATSSTVPTISMPSTLSIDVGSTGSAVASVTNYTGSVTYSSSDTGVATVDSSGLVTGVGEGTATITGSFTSDSKTYSDTCAVTVNAVTPRITLGQSAISLTAGGSAGSVSFTTANFSSTPTVTVSGGDTSIATISVGTSSITITPVAAGTLNLTVTATSGTQTGSASLGVTVAAAPVVGDSVTITADSTNVPASYSTSTTALSIEGLSLVAYNVGTSYSSGYIQFKGGSGYISNSTALSKPIASIVITYKSSVTTSPTTVTFGSSSGSLSAGTSSGNGTVWTYTPSGSGSTFFKILEGSSAGYVASIVINYAASSATLSSIAVTTQPAKTTYYVGDTFSSSGLVVTGTYDDSTTKAITDYTLSTPDMTSAGTKTITVTYSGLTTSFNITVNAVELSSIAITTAATTTTYYVGQTLSLSGLVVKATYNNGNTATITSYTTSPAAGTELTTAGTQNVTISYTDGSITKTTAYTITVNAVELTSIAVTAPTKITYTVNETLDTTGMVVTATYNNGLSAAVTGYTTDPANGATLSSTGNQTLMFPIPKAPLPRRGPSRLPLMGRKEPSLCLRLK